MFIYPVSCLLSHGPVLRGPQSDRQFTRIAFLVHFSCLFSEPHLLTTLGTKRPQDGSLETAPNHNTSAKLIIETHPQPRTTKRLHLGGVKPLKLTTFTTLSAVFPQAQGFQNKIKREPKSRFRVPKTGKNQTKEPLVTPRKQPTGNF